MGKAAQIVKAIAVELLRVYGAEFTEKCILFSSKGWVYFSRPKRDQRGNWIEDPISKPMRLKQAEKILEELRRMPDLEAVIEELKASTGSSIATKSQTKRIPKAGYKTYSS